MNFKNMPLISKPVSFLNNLLSLSPPIFDALRSVVKRLS